MIPNKFEKGAPTARPNLYDIPVNQYKLDDEGMRIFNEVYTYCLDMEDAGEFNRLTFTPSGGISITRDTLYGPMFGLRATSSAYELIVRDFDAKWVRIIIGNSKSGETVSGSRAYRVLRTELARDGIDIEDYFITPEEGLQVKETIPSPLICWYDKPRTNETIEHAHHLDLNSSYWSGILASVPEFAPTIERIYARRKDSPVYKAILTHSQGYFQGKPLRARLAHIARAGIVWNNDTITAIAKAVADSGRTVLAYNTDGFWYSGDPYHGIGEGRGLGQWKNDKINCTLRYKSRGAYEYISPIDGYHPVLRGRTRLDEVKPRSEWEWGDIYRADARAVVFDEELGLRWADNGEL